MAVTGRRQSATVDLPRWCDSGRSWAAIAADKAAKAASGLAGAELGPTGPAPPAGVGARPPGELLDGQGRRRPEDLAAHQAVWAFLADPEVRRAAAGADRQGRHASGPAR